MNTSLLHRLFDFIAPRTCVMCGRRLFADEEMLCNVCRLTMNRTHFAKEPYDNEMAQLFWHKLPIERAAALFYYTSESGAEPIYKFKYYGREDVAEYLGELAAQEFMKHGFFDGIDIIVPMPLAKNRQRMRGYNQCEAIAKGVSRVTGIGVESSLLTRKRFERSNTRLSREDRIENVENAFTLNDVEALKGKHVLIIDDVITTGATVVSLGKEITEKSDGVKISVMSIGYTCKK